MTARRAGASIALAATLALAPILPASAHQGPWWDAQGFSLAFEKPGNGKAKGHEKKNPEWLWPWERDWWMDRGDREPIPEPVPEPIPEPEPTLTPDVPPEVVEPEPAPTPVLDPVPEPESAPTLVPEPGPTPGPEPAPEPQPDPGEENDVTLEVQTVLNGHNAYRVERGLPPLVLSASMSEVAQSWSEEMASSGRLRHNPDYAAELPSGWTRVGENVAWNSDSGIASAGRVVQQWIDSPPHRENMVGPYTYVGIGIAEGGGRTYYTVNFGAYSHEPEPAPVPGPAPAPEPEPVAPTEPRAGEDIRVGFITGYTFHNNDPANSRALAHSTEWNDKALHTESGGTGTWEDPTTVATTPGTWEVGTRFYIPHLDRYFIMENDCATCGDRDPWLDVWIGGDEQDSAAATYACAEQITGDFEFIVGPEPDYPVVAGPLYDSATDTCYTPTP